MEYVTGDLHPLVVEEMNTLMGSTDVQQLQVQLVQFCMSLYSLRTCLSSSSVCLCFILLHPFMIIPAVL